jgi:hypothetical protein
VVVVVEEKILQGFAKPVQSHGGGERGAAKDSLFMYIFLSMGSSIYRLKEYPNLLSLAMWVTKEQVN